MSCEHLICAQCAGPVAEGRCPVCYAARARMHHHHSGPSMTLPLVAAVLIALLLMLLAVHLAH